MSRAGIGGALTGKWRIRRLPSVPATSRRALTMRTACPTTHNAACHLSGLQIAARAGLVLTTGMDPRTEVKRRGHRELFSKGIPLCFPPFGFRLCGVLRQVVANTSPRGVYHSDGSSNGGEREDTENSFSKTFLFASSILVPPLWCRFVRRLGERHRDFIGWALKTPAFDSPSSRRWKYTMPENGCQRSTAFSTPA